MKEDLQSQKRFDLPQSDHDFNTVLDTKTDSRFHKTSSNSSSSQSKQLPPQYLTFLKTTTKTSKRNKNVLREENYSPCCIITTTSASSSQKIWAELAGVPHRCYAFTFVDVNAPQNHNVVQLDEELLQWFSNLPSSGTLLNKLYSELQHIKDKCNQPVQYPTQLDGLRCTQWNTVHHLLFRLQKLRSRALKWPVQTHEEMWAELRLEVHIFWILCGSPFLYLA